MYDTLCERGAFFPTHMKIAKGAGREKYKILYPVTFDELIKAGMMHESQFTAHDKLPIVHGFSAKTTGSFSEEMKQRYNKLLNRN